MEIAISPELRKVRRFGGIARGLCIAFGVYVVVALALVAAMVAFGWRGMVNFGAFMVRGDEFTPVLAAWGAIVLLSLVVPGFIGLRRMYQLFDNLREGRIYTQENVRHIRQLGILGLIFPVLIPLLTVLSWLIQKAGYAPGAVLNDHALVFEPASLGAFIWPSLLLLASWIMENGRKLQDEADRMRRDAELTI